MKKEDKASISLKKVICVSIILLLLMGISVMAVNSKVKNVKIILSDGYEMNVLTTKEKVSDILDENHIILLPEEKVLPSLEGNVSDNKTIRITKEEVTNLEVTEVIQTSADVTAEKLLEENYNNIVEKIVVEKTAIPFETETKDVSNGASSKKEVIKRKGVDGLKETTYKIKYQNDVEISRAEVSTNIVKQPVNKIVEIRANEVVSRASVERANVAATSASANGNALAAKVEGMTPVVKTLNASAYTASTCGKSPSSSGYGITSSGARATAWCTVAAGKGYPIGTIIYIPYFANKPNGGWFIVQDRGGAISNNKLDVYMNTYNECINFGRRNLECYIYQFK
ncbi:MAG: hypothetical protein E7313_02320 [Clostridiales bacterium]|nr:hypothetical protein [Clostridiales bacterium]